ncbi:MAG: 6,7-dimethyl-8-ribityllumazine synthase [Porticoccaceae bacterium]|jgi:6,7-dimethyl-8-ribityllumazine synthase|nr:6,7-dimethyl-8-ribityllumazine synthase [Porticoccaceae bacterium]HLS99104.1 6,7-dimethyl-8-ribityllumazine synthase [Porticoccaceae bacterium]
MSKLRPIEGSFEAGDARIAIVVSRWNSEITESLLRGALATLARQGIPDDNILVARVPGAFELPLAAQKVAASGRIDAVIALGCVIRGDTPHFDYVCSECTRGLGRVSLDSGLPVGFGLLTCDDLAQAQARSADNSENKGEEAALTVLEMLSLFRQLR